MLNIIRIGGLLCLFFKWRIHLNYFSVWTMSNNYIQVVYVYIVTHIIRASDLILSYSIYKGAMTSLLGGNKCEPTPTISLATTVGMSQVIPSLLCDCRFSSKVTVSCLIICATMKYKQLFDTV